MINLQTSIDQSSHIITQLPSYISTWLIVPRELKKKRLLPWAVYSHRPCRPDGSDSIFDHVTTSTPRLCFLLTEPRECAIMLRRHANATAFMRLFPASYSAVSGLEIQSILIYVPWTFINYRSRVHVAQYASSVEFKRLLSRHACRMPVQVKRVIQ